MYVILFLIFAGVGYYLCTQTSPKTMSFCQNLAIVVFIAWLARWPFMWLVMWLASLQGPVIDNDFTPFQVDMSLIYVILDDTIWGTLLVLLMFFILLIIAGIVYNKMESKKA